MLATVRDTLLWAAQQLAALSHGSPRLEAELLLCDATGLDRVRLMAWPESEVGDSDLARFRAMVERRLAGEPIAYIRGRQAFWDIALRVTPDTLIPRPETELLVEIALAQLPPDAPLLVLDAGSGSGAIAAALARERPAWTLVATDRSMVAARVALGNLRRYANDDARIVNCDWLAPIAKNCLDALIANPPYIPGADPHLDRGDLTHEPRSALAAGLDGLDAIRDLSAQATSRLRPGGLIALEHGFDQGPEVRAIFVHLGLREIATHRDLNGHERATSGRLFH